MDMTGEQLIPARREVVWAALNDTDVLRECLPGCEAIERKSDTELTATIALRVGPVKATFNGHVTLSDLDPPRGYRITGEGSGGVAGFARGGATVRLEDQGTATLLRYEAKAEVGGKIAQLGARLVDSTAKRLAGEFFERFGAVATARDATVPAAPEPVGSPASPGWWSRLREWLGRLLSRPRAAG